jgi:hypothetical protein
MSSSVKAVKWTVDQAVACVLMVAALAVTYLVD